MILEILVIALGLGLLLTDLWTPSEQKKNLGYVAASGVGLLFLYSLNLSYPEPQYLQGHMFVMDELALFFKQYLLLAGAIVLLVTVEFSDRVRRGIVEYYVLILFALSGMMFSASANDFSLLFVGLELITVTFYILTSFQRHKNASLEAGVKYLILGALSSAFLVYGIAFIFGSTNTLDFYELAQKGGSLVGNSLLLLGLLLLLVGLGFKIAAFPFQIWAPDVYQGAPIPTTLLLAVGSKAAGIVLLLRVLFGAVPEVTANWSEALMWVSGLTILYGNLCALPQRNIKRMFGYSSIAHAGYILLGFSAVSQIGASAVLYYISGYLFTVLAAFSVICIVCRTESGEQIPALAGLHRRSPLLAAALTMSMVSLAGVPPLAGFFGKFLLLRAVLESEATTGANIALIAVVIVGVIISMYYYFGVIRAIYWTPAPEESSPVVVSKPMRATLYVCMSGMLYLGLFPGDLVKIVENAVKVFQIG